MDFSTTLATAAGVHLVTAVSFGVVARAIYARMPHGDERGAARGFVVWWLALAAYMVIEGTIALTGAFGSVPLGLYLATRALTVPLLVGATWGLVYYLVYLYTGDVRVQTPLVAFYAAIGVLFYYAVFVEQPKVLEVGDWLVRLEGAGEGLAYRIVYFAVGLPAILGSLAYAGLAVRLPERAQRYRVLLVSAAILGWVGSGLAAQLGTNDLLKFLTVVPMGLAAAVLVLLAYHPPARVRGWLARERAPAVASPEEPAGGRERGASAA